MDYRIEDIGEDFSGEVVKVRGNNEYVITINGRELDLRVLSMDSRGMEFVLGKKYHHARYLEASTSKMRLVVDGTPIQVRMHADLDEIVYKNSGGGGGGDAETALRSQIPGKVVSLSVREGSSVRKGDPVAVLESMKMQVAVKSHIDGTIKSIKVKEGDSVAKNDVIAEIG